MQANLSTSSFKRKRMALTVLFLVLLVLLVFLSGQVLEAMHNANVKVGTYYPPLRWNEYYSLEDNTIDLLFLGSSHAYRSYDPYIFEEKLGINAFNLGHSAQFPDSGYYIMQAVLMDHKPDIVVIDVYLIPLEREHYNTQNRYAYDYMQNSPARKAFWQDVFNAKDKFEYSLKFLRYRSHLIKWLTRVTDMDEEASPEHYKGKGHVSSIQTVTEETLYAQSNLAGYVYPGASDVQYDYLKQTIALCQQNGIDVVLVSAPLTKITFNNISDYDRFLQDVDKVCQTYDVPFLDYNVLDPDMFEDASTFTDFDHLNGAGATIISTHIANYLARHYFD